MRANVASQLLFLLLLLLVPASLMADEQVAMSNPDFESGTLYVGWNWPFSFANATTETDYAQSGTYSVKFYEQYPTGDPNYFARIRQYPIGGDWAEGLVVSGDVIEMGGWFLNPSTNPLQPGQTGEILIRVRNAATQAGHIECSDVIDCNTPTDTWIYLEAIMAVPDDGNDYTYVEMRIRGVGTGTGSFYADNVHTTLITSTDAYEVDAVEFGSDGAIESVTVDSARWNTNKLQAGAVFDFNDEPNTPGLFVDTGAAAPPNQPAAEALVSDLQIDTGVVYAVTADVCDAGLFHFDPPLVPHDGADIIIIKKKVVGDDNINVGVLDSNDNILAGSVKTIEKGDCEWYDRLFGDLIDSGIINPDLESRDVNGMPVGWSGLNASGSASGVARSGNYSAKYSDIQPNDGNPFGYVSQYPVGGDWNNSVVAIGDIIEVTAFLMSDPCDPVRSGQGALLTMNIWGNTSGVWDANTIWGEHFISGATVPGEWIFANVSGVVPDTFDANSLLLLEIYALGQDWFDLDGCAVYVDDFEVTITRNAAPEDRDYYVVTGSGGSWGMTGPTVDGHSGISAVAVGFLPSQDPISSIRISSDYEPSICEVLVLPDVQEGSCQSGIYLLGDLNRDCYVDVLDIAVFAEDWLTQSEQSDLNDSSNVDFVDHSLLANDWFENTDQNNW